jgi:hypothetical protein
MNPYLNRLRALKSGKTPPRSTDETDKTGSVSFDSPSGCHFLQIQTADASLPPTLQNPKKQHLDELTELTKPGSVGFDSDAGCQFLEIQADGDALTAALRELEQCPAYVPEQRWRQCLQDGQAFLERWGEQALALGWTGSDLFGLHQPPDRPHASYSRLSRYDCLGLCWLLQGAEVTALTSDVAMIRRPSGAITKYRRSMT